MSRNLLFGLILACWTGVGAAQQAGVSGTRVHDHEPSKTQIVMLGTAGGPILQSGRSEPATLIIVNGTPYLFDCGTGTVGQLMRAGVRPESLSAIFITHNHADHNLGLAELISNDRLAMGWKGQSLSWPVIGPVGTAELVEAGRSFSRLSMGAFWAEHLVDKLPSDTKAGPSPFAVSEIGTGGEVYRDDNIRVSAVENTHYSLMDQSARERFKSFSFRIDTADASIVITGDTGPSDAVTQLAKGADVIISEFVDLQAMAAFFAAHGKQAGSDPALLRARMDHMRREHLELPEVGTMARASSAGSVILTHFGPDTQGAQPGTLAARVRQNFEGQVVEANDLDRFCIIPRKERSADLVLRPCI